MFGGTSLIYPTRSGVLGSDNHYLDSANLEVRCLRFWLDEEKNGEEKELRSRQALGGACGTPNFPASVAIFFFEFTTDSNQGQEPSFFKNTGK